jgi:1,2-diacylglycerol-3-alpha-glucose alpha-1,2-galactosyltransferase
VRLIVTVNESRIRVNHVSESAFSAKAHGVHSAFVDGVEALRDVPDMQVMTNSLRRADIVHLHTVGPFSLLLLALSSCSVVTAHVTAESLAGSVVGGRLLGPVWRRYLTWFYNRADAVITLNSGQEAALRQSGVVSRLITVHTGIGRADLTSRAQARTLLGIRDDERVVLSVGQVQPRKAPSAFHRTAAALPDVRFIWVGGFPFGPLTASYRQMRDLIRRRPANVVHTGVLPRRLVQVYYAAADVYLQPSLQENAPVAVLEAAAAGLPLVLRDLDCYRRLFPGRYLGADDASFGDQVRRLLTEPTLRRAMASHAVALAEHYARSQSASHLAEVYRRLALRTGLTTGR